MEATINYKHLKNKARATAVGWWVLAFMVTVLVHLILVYILIKYSFFDEIKNMVAKPVEYQRIAIKPDNLTKPIIQDAPQPMVQEIESIKFPKVDFFDVADDIKKLEVDMSPTIEKEIFAIDQEKIGVEQTALIQKDLNASLEQSFVPASISIDLKKELSALQPKIQFNDTATNWDKIDDYTQNLFEGTTKDGQAALAGFTSLEGMLQLSSDQLNDKKTYIGGDLLFAFNSSDLKDSFKFSLYKIAMLIDKNPNMVCWIEGHADTIGDPVYNQQLSEQRAQAVKDWLVETLRFNPNKIRVKGYGSTQPLVNGITPEEQAINRRVEIKLRIK